jgi:hypothetical protein
MRKKNPPEARMQAEIEGEGNGKTVVLAVDVKRKGKWVRIAKRYSGQNWISLEPGYTVRGSEPSGASNAIYIEYTPANTRLQ